MGLVDGEHCGRVCTQGQPGIDVAGPVVVGADILGSGQPRSIEDVGAGVQAAHAITDHKEMLGTKCRGGQHVVCAVEPHHWASVHDVDLERRLGGGGGLREVVGIAAAVSPGGDGLAVHGVIGAVPGVQPELEARQGTR